MSNPENIKSSTDTNLVRVEYILTQLIWTQYFLKDQGYDFHVNVIYQDNQSTIRLENNDRRSSINQKRHANIRYYFITDSITNQDSQIELCPTLDIIRDYFINSLQGYQFRRFLNIIIFMHEDDIPSYNVSVRALLVELKIKLGEEKEEAHKASKLTGD